MRLALSSNTRPNDAGRSDIPRADARVASATVTTFPSVTCTNRQLRRDVTFSPLRSLSGPVRRAQTKDVNRDPILVYDGDCAFCSASVRLGQRVLTTPARWMPWQFLDLGALGLTREQAVEAVQWVATDGTVTSGPRAIAALLRSAGGAWPLVGRILALPGVLWLAGLVYRWIARNRYRLPGGTPACAVPR